MAVSIHHGAPGAYKTSGVVNDVVVPAVKAGRPIVTNVRGLSTERCLELYSDAPQSFEIIFVDTTVKEGRDRIARWFHWVPNGALLVLDEAQSLFPKKWRQSDVDALDYLGGIDQASEDSRPHDWSTAWEMHRHYNWDIYLTTPSIKLIRPDIREVCEGAYRHKNLAVIGLKGRYLEGYHSADSNGSATDFITVERKRIRKETWGLYDSTTTGINKDTSSATSLFKNGRLMLALLLCSGSLGYSVYSFSTSDGLLVSAAASDQATDKAAPVSSGGGRRPASADGVGNVGAQQSSGLGVVDYSSYGLSGHPSPVAEYSTVYRLVGFMSGRALIKSRFGGSLITMAVSDCSYRESYCTLGDGVRITKFSGVIVDEK